MITGIIAEYNIFHNGHKYLIDEIKNCSDSVVAVMSGEFVQRGDVAITDKWYRAKTALLNGVDLVLELPVCYALNAAPNFAAGGVNTLNALGVVDSIAFGSECGDIDKLKNIAKLLDNESEEISAKIKKLISDGMSYPSALSSSYSDNINGGLLDKPNNILAIEYIRALNRTDSSIEPVTIKRNDAGHDSDIVKGTLASASKIRELLINGDNISKFIPYSATGMNLRRVEQLDSALTAKLRMSSPRDIKNINEMSEGLENRIIALAKEASGFYETAEAIKSKRYTMSKIRRILLNVLLNFTSDIYSPYPEYIRVLGMNKKGMDILKTAKKVCKIPIITKTADYTNKSKQFELDLRATDIAALCFDNPSLRAGDQDLKRSPVVIK